MKYKAAREDIRTGDVVLTKGTSLGSKFIRLFTGSKYSHAGFAFWMSDIMTGRRRLMMIESSIGGTRIVSLSSYMRDGFDVYSGLQTTEWGFASPHILQNMGAIKYGYMDFVTIFLKEKFGMKVGDPKGEVCSEFVAKTLAAYSRQFRAIGGSQSPQRLSENIKRLNGGVKIEVETEDATRYG